YTSRLPNSGLAHWAVFRAPLVFRGTVPAHLQHRQPGPGAGGTGIKSSCSISSRQTRLIFGSLTQRCHARPPAPPEAGCGRSQEWEELTALLSSTSVRGTSCRFLMRFEMSHPVPSLRGTTV